MNWLPIKDYENLYEVSDTGQVRSLDRIIPVSNQNDRVFKGKVLSQTPNKNTQYLMVNLWKNNKGTNYYSHRLVAQAFIDNPCNLPEVNHKDGNKQNNNVSNLEWVDKQGNVNHAIETGLKVYTNSYTEKEFLVLLHEVIKGKSYVELSKEVNYKVPFLSTKLRKIAQKHGLEAELDSSLKQQQTSRSKTHNANQKRLKVSCFTHEGVLVKTYDSISEAGRDLNINNGAISNAVSGRTKTCKGFIWKSV